MLECIKSRLLFRGSGARNKLRLKVAGRKRRAASREDRSGMSAQVRILRDTPRAAERHAAGLTAASRSARALLPGVPPITGGSVTRSGMRLRVRIVGP